MAEQPDIVDRLRHFATQTTVSFPGYLADAADEIERLRLSLKERTELQIASRKTLCAKIEELESKLNRAEAYTQSRLDAFQQRVIDLGYDDLEALIAVFQRNINWLDLIDHMRIHQSETFWHAELTAILAGERDDAPVVETCDHRWSDPSIDAPPVTCTKCGASKVRVVERRAPFLDGIPPVGSPERKEYFEEMARNVLKTVLRESE